MDSVSNQEFETNTQPTRHSRIVVVVLALLFASISMFGLFQFLNTPPDEFPVQTEIVIREGLSQKQIAHVLEEQNIIRSSFLLLAVFNRMQDDELAKAGVYIFDRPLTTEEVAQTLVIGDQNVAYIKITFPEGFSSKNFSSFLPETLAGEGANETPSRYEGYLFPDTYFLPKQASVDELITMMRSNFENKLAPYEETIEHSEFTRDEVITLASLVEREAKDTASKKIVAGILLNRLEIGMPLQVDAVFDYLIDKESAELTIADLDIDSPYNTYRYAGLPPGPIANPGIESIDAVLNPTTTAYMYYLTSPDGTFYYAETFDEHVSNKQRYLR